MTISTVNAATLIFRVGNLLSELAEHLATTSSLACIGSNQEDFDPSAHTLFTVIEDRLDSGADELLREVQKTIRELSGATSEVAA